MMQRRRERYIPTCEAALLLGVTASYVRRLCRDGRIAGARRIGRDWCIPLPYGGVAAQDVWVQSYRDSCLRKYR